MKIDILTLFPEICRAPLSESMMKRAQENKIVDLRIHNLRDWTNDKHHIVDDAPFGGGQGMVMKPEPIFAAVEELQKSAISNQQAKIILMSPGGRRLDQKLATELSKESHLTVVCGHYEGVDNRVIDHLVDLEVSIGDYVLTNGAIAAVVLVDAVVRLLPGVLGHEQSAQDDSFSAGLLEAPQYTRPAEFRGWKIPQALLSGNHIEIASRIGILIIDRRRDPLSIQRERTKCGLDRTGRAERMRVIPLRSAHRNLFGVLAQNFFDRHRLRAVVQLRRAGMRVHVIDLLGRELRVCERIAHRANTR